MTITFVTFLVSFLGMGLYNLDKLHHNDTELTTYRNAVVKQCNKTNLSKEEQEDCLKIFVPVK